jgi:hypothetical protein
MLHEYQEVALRTLASRFVALAIIWFSFTSHIWDTVKRLPCRLASPRPRENAIAQSLWSLAVYAHTISWVDLVGLYLWRVWSAHRL